MLTQSNHVEPIREHADATGNKRLPSFLGEQTTPDIYKKLSPDEETDCVKLHYNLPARVFELVNGGKWKTYSSGLWDGIEDPDPKNDEHLTRSQEQKLDVYGQMMELRPGARVLDVGCGWGGPLIYLAKKYGIRGQGLMLSEEAHAFATAWAAREGVDVKYRSLHWAEFQDPEPFDAIMTDESTCHFSHIDQFFAWCRERLREGGVMVNKEVHLNHPSLGTNLNRSAKFFNAFFGETLNYRSLADELSATHGAGFLVEEVRQLGHVHYDLTASAWYHHYQQNREELIALLGKKLYRDFGRFLLLIIASAGGTAFHYKLCESHWVKARKVPRETEEQMSITPA